MIVNDEDVWPSLPPEDLWVYDKLILSRKLGYACGPTGVRVPCPNEYIVRPITNLCGMGRGARILYLTDKTDHLPYGYFWCETFEGRHLSVDYVDGEQTLCVEGFRSSSKLYKWDKWVITEDRVPYHPILHTLTGKYQTINCEFIGDKLIEIHLRGNPDFQVNTNEIIVVWEGDDTTPPEGMKFVEAKDFKRLGFFVQQEIK